MPQYVRTPLAYCMFRSMNVDREVEECVQFATAAIEHMPFCERHASMVSEAMLKEDVEFVRDQQEGVVRKMKAKE